MFKKQNGITLVALIITIIVMLILAGVSISLVVGENGVLTQAQNAGDATKRGEAQQAIELAFADLLMQYYDGNDESAYTLEKLVTAIKDNGNYGSDSSFKVAFTGALRYDYTDGDTSKTIADPIEVDGTKASLSSASKYADFYTVGSGTSAKQQLDVYTPDFIAANPKIADKDTAYDTSTTPADSDMRFFIGEGTLKIWVETKDGEYLFDVVVKENNGKYQASEVNYVKLDETLKQEVAINTALQS